MEGKKKQQYKMDKGKKGYRWMDASDEVKKEKGKDGGRAQMDRWMQQMKERKKAGDEHRTDAQKKEKMDGWDTEQRRERKNDRKKE